MKLVELAAALTLATNAAALALATNNAAPALPTDMAELLEPHSQCIYRKTSHPETNIQFRKWAELGCDINGEPDADHKVSHGKCNNLNYGLQSFLYTPKKGWFRNDDDYQDCRCFVFVHPEPHCQGTPYCTGPLWDGKKTCHNMTDAGMTEGWSAVVRCDPHKTTKWYDICKSSPAFKLEQPSRWDTWQPDVPGVGGLPPMSIINPYLPPGTTPTVAPGKGATTAPVMVPGN